jgi:transposase-like protein
MVHRSHQGAKMNKKSGTSKDAADKLVKGIRRKTRKQYSAEEKIRIVLAGLRGEESIAALCRREGYQREPVLHVVKGIPGSGQAVECPH